MLTGKEPVGCMQKRLDLEAQNWVLALALPLRVLQSRISDWTSLSPSFLTGKRGLPYQPHTDIVRTKHRLQQKSWSKKEPIEV